MALFLRDQVAQFYGVRVVKGKDSKERVYADIGFLSSSKVKGTDDYAADEPLYVSVLVKGQEAQKAVNAAETKSLLSITAKIYSYSVEKNGKKERREGWEILTAAPFIPQKKEAAAAEPSFSSEKELEDMPF
jgi:hypothetical protein